MGPADGDAGRAAPSLALCRPWLPEMGGLTVDEVSVQWSGRSVLSPSRRLAHFPLLAVELCSVAFPVVTIRTG